MSAFKTCLIFLFFLRVLRAINIYRNLKKKKSNLQLSENNASDISRFSKAKAFLSNGKNYRKVRSAARSWDTAAHRVRCTFQTEFWKFTLAWCLPNNVNFACCSFSLFFASLSLHPVLVGRGGASVCVYISLYTYVRLSLACHYKRLGKILLPTELKIK